MVLNIIHNTLDKKCSPPSHRNDADIQFVSRHCHSSELQLKHLKGD